MKIFYLFLIMPFFCFSQTHKEREAIISTYDVNKIDQLKAQAKAFTIEQKKLIETYRLLNPSLKESENLSLQRIYDGLPIFFSISNAGSSKTIRTSSLYPNGGLGLSLTGSGITAGVWDGGKVRNTHQEFTNNRVTPNDIATDLSAHATHVTGTILAAGVSPTRKGIAYAAQALTHDWNSDYEEMVTFGSQGYLVSNHSYGYNTLSLPVWLFGSYDASSKEIDDLSNAFPFYQIVVAAGNDRDNSNLEQSFSEGGYDLISGTGCSKNGITVAAVEEVLNYSNSSSVIMSDFSNYGPPDDGRIKPDIAAKGVDVNSSISTSNAVYASYNGTSMAAPAITGAIVLLQKHYNNLNSSYMRASTVRGLICHSAREAGVNPGPDYEFGWGLADAETAANIISKKGVSSVIEENTLLSSEIFTRQIAVGVPQRLIVTIAWTDPTGIANGTGVNDNRAPRLKNNLDLKIIKDGITYYPWKMNPDDPYAGATRDSDNNVDNVEKVEIDLAQPGNYIIQINHKGTLTGGSQAFSLIASGAVGVTLSNETFAKNNDIFIYPNPADDTLNFSLASSIQLSDASIFDVTGKKVGSLSDKNATSLDVSNLQSGVYFVKFTADNNIVTKKFIKK